MEVVKSQQSELRDRETKDHRMLPKNVDALSGKEPEEMPTATTTPEKVSSYSMS